jgi:hypothetical protein
MKLFGLFMVGIIIDLWVAIFQGLTIMVLWGWFVAPSFGVQELTISLAVGLSLTVKTLTATWIKHEEEKKEEDIYKMFVKSILAAPFHSATILTFGYVITLFM